MSVMIELLARGLTGVDHGLPSNQGYNGTLVIALDIAAFAPVEQFEAAAERLCEQIGGSTPSGGYERVLLPGEPERIARREREANGISLPDATWNELTALATELGVAI